MGVQEGWGQGRSLGARREETGLGVGVGEAWSGGGGPVEGGRGSSVPRTAGGHRGALGEWEGLLGHRQGPLTCTEEVRGGFSQNSFWEARREAGLLGGRAVSETRGSRSWTSFRTLAEEDNS